LHQPRAASLSCCCSWGGAPTTLALQGRPASVLTRLPSTGQCRMSCTHWGWPAASTNNKAEGVRSAQSALRSASCGAGCGASVVQVVRGRTGCSSAAARTTTRAQRWAPCAKAVRPLVLHCRLEAARPLFRACIVQMLDDVSEKHLDAAGSRN
jgi:hypothetical protein